MPYDKKQLAPEDRLLVIEDLDNGYEFYMHKLDLFRVGNREYAVFAPYEPDDGEHNAPDIVIMRVYRVPLKGKNKRQTSNSLGAEIQFESIKDQAELDAAFTVFNERMVADIMGFE